jgi:hypothetical protein
VTPHFPAGRANTHQLPPAEHRQVPHHPPCRQGQYNKLTQRRGTGTLEVLWDLDASMDRLGASKQRRQARQEAGLVRALRPSWAVPAGRC